MRQFWPVGAFFGAPLKTSRLAQLFSWLRGHLAMSKPILPTKTESLDVKSGTEKGFRVTTCWCGYLIWHRGDAELSALFFSHCKRLGVTPEEHMRDYFFGIKERTST